MKNKNLIVMTFLAAVLLSGLFVSFATAEANVSDITTLHKPTASPAPDRSAIDSSDCSTVTQGDEVLHTLQDNSTSTDDAQVPGEAEPNLITTLTSTPDSTLLIASIAVVLAIIVGGASGIFFYRKSATKN